MGYYDSNVCNTLDQQIGWFPKGVLVDIYLSKSLYKELCKAFGGHKVTKYKGHKIIVG